jgi:hypothetical protein
MFMNLHTVPTGQSMFTFTVNNYGDPLDQHEEVDMVIAHDTHDTHRLVTQVMEAAREKLVADFGPTVQVLFIANQSQGYPLFDCRVAYHVPLPVVLAPTLAVTFDRPYEALLDLALDDPDNSYRDFLMER